MLARRQIGGTFTRRGDVDVVECARENEGAPLFSFNQNCVPPEWERVEDCSKDRAADAN